MLSIFKKHNGTYKLNEIFYARSKSIIRIHDRDNHILTIKHITKLKKCINLESVTICMCFSVSDIVIEELFNLPINKLTIRVIGGKINIPKNITNDKLKELTIDIDDKSEITAIPKEIFEMNLKSVAIGGLIMLEQPKYFPNLFNYNYIIIMNGTVYNNYLFNGEHEMFLDICDDDIKKRYAVLEEKEYFIPNSITKLKIKIPIVYEPTIELQKSIIKLMNNLPDSIEILILDLFLPYPDYFKNLPVGLKELHLKKGLEPLLEDITTHFKIPADTEIKFY